jgi:predicted unusual protein kinase regulating ubiquinone biosynthesis (AarF/ABC1/UbiB family)
MSDQPYRTRYRRITFFFARIILGLAAWELIFPRLGLSKWVRRTRTGRLRMSAARFRRLAIEMGGVLIKVGQFLSSRVDVLPREITEELAGLQDEVPAESFQDIRRVVEAEYGQPLAEKFSRFDPSPLAAASLGQVHCATIHPVQERQAEAKARVVVKVQRPNIEKILDVDLAALKKVSGWLNRYPPIRKRADVPALMDEFSRILHEEIDYLAEGRNAETFAANFKEDKGILVPGVIWSHTTRRVLTLEDVRAIKITDYEAITAAGVDRGEVARRLLGTYLKQIFEDGFFHADPHPGNLFVMPDLTSPPPSLKGKEETPSSLSSGKPLDNSGKRGGGIGPAWKLTFVDFGMVGRMSPKMREGMRELVIGVGTRDPARVVKSYQVMGVLLPGADLSLLEKAESEAFTRFWGKSMSELQQIDLQEMVAFARQFQELLYSLPFQIPEDLILLGRSVGILSGMCTGLDPDFNVWNGIAPFARKLIAEEAAAGRENWLEALGGLARRLASLPIRTESILEKVERGELAVHDPQLARQVHRLEGAIIKATGAVVFAALLLGGVQLVLGGYQQPGIALLSVAGLVFLFLLFARN